MKTFNDAAFIRYAGLLTEDWRLQLVQGLLQYWTQDPAKSILDAFQNTDWCSKYPQWKQVLERLHQENTFRKLVMENPRLCDRLMQDLLGWFKKAGRHLQRSDPYFSERMEFQQAKASTQQLDWSGWQALTKKLEAIYPTHTQKLWDFYTKQYQELQEHQQHLQESLASENAQVDQKSTKEQVLMTQEFEALQRKLLEDWENLLWQKTVQDEQAKLNAALTELLQLLNARYARLQKLYDELQGFFQYFGRSWDLSQGVWENVPWQELERYAKMLENEKSLQDLAELLGRFARTEKEYENEILQKVVIEYQWQVDHASKSEIVGVHHSDDLSNLLPSELALLTSPLTEVLFAKNFVEKKLLTWEYQGQTWAKIETIGMETVQKAKEDKRGPVIICVDTSGSMSGTPEYVAKTITLALTNIARRDNRKCYLISFSTQIATLDLSDLDQSLPKLVQFLSMGFHGGTDAFPPLQEALKMLKTSDYQKADVLMVSDFIVPQLPESMTEAIVRQQRRNQTHFHSLTIAEQGNVEAMQVFDTNWIYRLSDSHNMRSVIEKLAALFPKL